MFEILSNSKKICYNTRSIILEEFALFFKEKGMAVEPLDFSAQSTIGCGPHASQAVYPRSFTELIELIDFCVANKKRYAILGSLSNVLPPEQESRTLFIITKRLVGATFGETPLVYTGMTASAFLKECEIYGKTGAEFLAGIPCTMGGAAFMNAGACGRYMDEIVRSVIVYRKGELKSFAKEECQYSYKHSRFMEDGSAIFAVMLNLSNAAREEVAAKKKEYLEKRKALPIGRSMGCIFKNPAGLSAGQLIEGAGLKGLRIGGAHISEVHANFIINDKGATVRDVKTLIQLMKNAVYAQYRVQLEEEIRYLV